MPFEEFERLTVEQLRERGGSKWVAYPDAIGSYIAESDFGTAPSVRRVLERLVGDAALGYSSHHEKEAASEALAQWSLDRFGWRIDASQIGLLPEVLTSLEVTLEHYSQPGTPVVVPTPAYMPFFGLLRDHGREVVETPLIRDESAGWSFDYEAIERAFAAGARLLILVNPANPTGTVFTAEQLLPLVDIVDRHGGRVWADEIHAPIIYEGREHVPYASLNETAALHTVTATSASKGWNIPGLKCSQIVFTNPDDAKIWPRVGKWPSHTTGHLGIFATTAAYNDGREWLDELVLHLQARRAGLGRLVAEHLPRAGYVPAEGTYLAWLDLREYGLGERNLQSFLLREAGVAATDGRQCGRDWQGFLRINFATPAAILEEKVARIAAALEGRAR